jgi:polyhydroxyalkanoate synthesis regulator protein
MGTFARQQDGMRRAAQEAMGSASGVFNAFAPFEEMGKQNLAMLERAMSLFSPFPARAGGATAPNQPVDEVEAMREELAALREEVAVLRRNEKPG